MTEETKKVRIDRWLWAARFFKTRSLAKTALEGGKVHIDGHKAKPSKLLEVGMTLCIRQGWDEKTIEVTALTEQRRGAPEAALLYRETEQSIRQRTERADERKALNTVMTDGRPSKKQRRQIQRFKNIFD